MAKGWSPQSWRGIEARQQPVYADEASLCATVGALAAYPPLVPIAEVRALAGEVAEAQAGRAFFLQAGDCAESFADFRAETVDATLSLFGNVAYRLAEASGLPVVRIARMAGQFAKPRSRALETRDAVSLPTYRGDIVNAAAFDEAARRPDPQRMFRAYAQSAATLNRLASEGIYSSHEALLLPYEEALVRRDGLGWYGSSGHFLWIGDRTRFEGSAHVELMRGLLNPIGVKCGATAEPDELCRLLEALNPTRRPGRVTLIARLGATRVEKRLPRLIRAARQEGHPVLWCCDPMHGNTVRAASGHKTRRLADILAEIGQFFAVCRQDSCVPGGLHIEMAGSQVAECTGGVAGVTEGDLTTGYASLCDPRLNPAQTVEVADAVAAELGAGRQAAVA
ncbi:MAG TPA: 3-deoxy-7-phosphoheptulonate synthase [Allosphingosinicella sp.]|nr:3-deoxy-7-phosphoheptulonate synthase [Allosphingosinicella sp.]